MTGYRLYGLRLQSQLELPELRTDPGPPDVVLTFGQVERRTYESAHVESWFRPGVDEATWFTRGIAAIRVRGGKEILVDAAPDATPAALRTAVVGPIFSLLLLQRGLLPLHASSLRLGPHAIAIAGDSGAGKSTLAAALHARGHALVADDVTAIEVRSERPRVQPSFAQLRLEPGVVQLLGRSIEGLEQVRPEETRLALPVSEGFQDEPLPLGAIYLLSDGPLEVAPLSRTEAFFEIQRLGHRMELLHACITEQDLMGRCSQVARHVPVFLLRRPRGLERLDATAEALEAHALG